MKYIKQYEKYIRALYKKGDHVILNDKVIDQNNLTDNSDNIKYTKWFNLKEIIFFSPNMEDINSFLQSKKYNI